MNLLSDLEYPVFDDVVANMDIRTARYNLVNKLWRYLDVKPEFPPMRPSIFDILEGDEKDPVQTWVDKAHVDNVILSLPKTWNLMI